tara:strand:- start:151 stop:465 length:315 start_codon:yes stop_codon:yes gene_type:complete
MKNIFVYGSLLNKTLRTNVLGHEVEGIEDILEDYTIDTHSVLSRYPTIIKSEGELVKGEIFKVSDSDIEKMDRYESHYYKKIEVTLKSKVMSLVYIERHFNVSS